MVLLVSYFNYYYYLQYLGLWYEQERYFAFFQINGKCVTATYTDNMNGTVGVENYQMNSQ